MEATVDPLPRGPDWMPITPKRGSLFHAETQFKVRMNGTTHIFDSFECAIHALAPTCDNCGIRILGHGLEKEGTFFCCEHCAEVKGMIGLRDRIGAGGVIEMGSRV